MTVDYSVATATVEVFSASSRRVDHLANVVHLVVLPISGATDERAVTAELVVVETGRPVHTHAPLQDACSAQVAAEAVAEAEAAEATVCAVATPSSVAVPARLAPENRCDGNGNSIS